MMMMMILIITWSSWCLLVCSSCFVDVEVEQCWFENVIKIRLSSIIRQCCSHPYGLARHLLWFQSDCTWWSVIRADGIVFGIRSHLDWPSQLLMAITVWYRCLCQIVAAYWLLVTCHWKQTIGIDNIREKHQVFSCEGDSYYSGRAKVSKADWGKSCQHRNHLGNTILPSYQSRESRGGG